MKRRVVMHNCQFDMKFMVERQARLGEQFDVNRFMREGLDKQADA